MKNTTLALLLCVLAGVLIPVGCQFLHKNAGSAPPLGRAGSTIQPEATEKGTTAPALYLDASGKPLAATATGIAPGKFWLEAGDIPKEKLDKILPQVLRSMRLINSSPGQVGFRLQQTLTKDSVTNYLGSHTSMIGGTSIVAGIEIDGIFLLVCSSKSPDKFAMGYAVDATTGATTSW